MWCHLSISSALKFSSREGGDDVPDYLPFSHYPPLKSTKMLRRKRRFYNPDTSYIIVLLGYINRRPYTDPESCEKLLQFSRLGWLHSVALSWFVISVHTLFIITRVLFIIIIVFSFIIWEVIGNTLINFCAIVCTLWITVTSVNQNEFEQPRGPELRKEKSPCDLNKTNFYHSQNI